MMDHLETREVPAIAAPTAFEQVFLERVNDARESLGGVNSRPFAWLTELDVFADGATRNRNGKAFKNRIDRAGIPWNRSKSFTANAYRFEFSESIPTDNAGLTEFAEGFASLATRNPPPGTWPVVGQPGKPRYRSHRIIGFHVAIEDGRFSYEDLTLAYRGRNPLVTGVVYRDANSNGKYDAGEGLSGVTVSAGRQGSTQTWETGGYTLALRGGRPRRIAVTMSGGELGSPVTTMIRVRPSRNSRLNFAVA